MTKATAYNYPPSPHNEHSSALSNPHCSLIFIPCWHTGTSPPAWYLDAVDVHAAHASTAVYEEDKLSLGFPEVWLDGPQVRAEVEHDDRVVGDVLVQPLPDNFSLQERRTELKMLFFSAPFHVEGNQSRAVCPKM